MLKFLNFRLIMNFELSPSMGPIEQSTVSPKPEANFSNELAANPIVEIVPQSSFFQLSKDEDSAELARVQ